MATGVPLSHWRKDSGIIPAGQTIDISTDALSSFKSADFKLVFSNASETIENVLNVKVWKDAGDVKHQVYTQSPFNLDIKPNVLVVGSDAVLRVVNGESFGVNFSLLKAFI